MDGRFHHKNSPDNGAGLLLLDGADDVTPVRRSLRRETLAGQTRPPARHRLSSEKIQRKPNSTREAGGRAQSEFRAYSTHMDHILFH